MKDKDWEEEEESKGNNSDEDDGYLLGEILLWILHSHPPACHVNNGISTLNNPIL